MTKRVRKVDRVMQRSFNEYYKTLQPDLPSSLEPPIKGIIAVKDRFGITRNELAAWRNLAFPLYNIKGAREREQWFANPERVQAWFRWRDLVQCGAIVVDPAQKVPKVVPPEESD